MAQANGEAAVKIELTPEQVFEKAAKIVAARSRDINKSVKDWQSGDSELTDLILEIQLGQRKLQKALMALDGAHKGLTGK